MNSAETGSVIELFKRIAHLEAELAKEKGGWDAFYKLRKSVGEERYPHLTGEIKASSAETAGEPLPKLECGMGCGRTFCSPEGRDHHEELCEGPTSKTEGEQNGE